MAFTPRRIVAYAEIILEQRRGEMGDRLSLSRMAAHAKPEDIRRTLKDLRAPCRHSG